MLNLHERSQTMLSLYLSMVDTDEQKSFVENVYLKYEQDMYKVALGILHNKQDAEDAVHDAFIQIVRNVDKIIQVDRPKLRGFLVIIIRNCSINIYRKRKKDAHFDIDDEDQTTYVVDISTTARGNSSADNEEFASEKTVIVDTVSYKNLIPGKEYKVSGTIMVKETGKEVLDKDGKPVTAETTFKAVSENGSIDITFPAFDGTAIAGKDIVVFEKLYIIGAGKKKVLLQSMRILMIRDRQYIFRRSRPLQRIRQQTVT